MQRSRWVGLVTAVAAAGLFSGLATVPAHAAATAGRHAPAHVGERGPIGAVTIGQVVPTGTSTCSDDLLLVLHVSNPALYTAWVPFEGVITSVSSFANSQPTASIQAVFLRETSNPGMLDLLQRSPVLTLAPGRLNTFPVRIPVQAGEVLGMRTVTGGARCLEAGTATDSTLIGSSNDGDTTFFPIVDNANVVTDISAVWEPDQDGDGYGDVSQDGCPGLATVHDPCPAPVVTVTKRPAKRTRAHRVKVKFRADVVGSTFACSIDGRTFKSCHSPFKGRFVPGTHTVRVMATSPVGVPGQPVAVQFKVVKPKR